MKKYLLVSTVGTSILTNVANQDQRYVLLNSSNCNSSDCSDELKATALELSEKAKLKLESDSIKEQKRSCAELNGIISIRETYNIKNEQIFHFLITTDTYQGNFTGSIIESYLEKLNPLGVSCHSPSGLNTLSKTSFDSGIKELLKWCENTLPGYVDNNYEVLFNLTGSFKALQGYLTAIGMFYADKINYIFDGKEPSLLEIPSLPIEIDTKVFENNIAQFLLMSVGANLPFEDVKNINSALVDSIENEYFFSVWGQLLWNKKKSAALEKNVPQFDNIVYSESFKKDLKSQYSTSDKSPLFEAIAKASMLLSENNGNVSKLNLDGGLLYEKYKNKVEQGVPIGHFRINNGDRISCIQYNSGLLLRHCGRHDYVNDNP